MISCRTVALAVHTSEPIVFSRVPFLNPGDGPLCVFRNESVGILAGVSQGREVFPGSGVAEHDADISKEAGTLDPLDGGLPEEVAKVLVGESEEVS